MCPFKVPPCLSTSFGITRCSRLIFKVFITEPWNQSWFHILEKDNLETEIWALSMVSCYWSVISPLADKSLKMYIGTLTHACMHVCICLYLSIYFKSPELILIFPKNSWVRTINFSSTPIPETSFEPSPFLLVISVFYFTCELLLAVNHKCRSNFSFCMIFLNNFLLIIKSNIYYLK